MVKQLSFPYMRGEFRHRFNNVYVLDFEYATVAGALLPTSLAIKNINDVGKGDNTLPENIDYSASMERLFPT